MNTHNDKNELKEAPFLAALARSEPFLVPDGFFERFPHQVQKHIHTPARGWRMAAWPGTERLVVMAASVTVLIGALLLLKPLFITATRDPLAEVIIAPAEVPYFDLHDEELLAAFESGSEQFAYVAPDWNTAELAAYLGTQELSIDLLNELQ